MPLLAIEPPEVTDSLIDFCFSSPLRESCEEWWDGRR